VASFGVRKTSLCEALHERAVMTGVGAPWPTMRVLLGEGREEEEEGERVWQLGGSPWGLLGEAGAPGWLPTTLLVREGTKERSVRWLLFA
jgi:hypothetical protein